MEWMVHELAARAGVTRRTLRHYDRIGLLAPSRVGANGYRYYGPAAVARLQRILLMRRMGLGLAAIAGILADEVDEEAALRAHIAALEGERDRIEQRIRAVRHTLQSVLDGTEPCMDVMLDGFNDGYRDEVVSRWVAAWRAGDAPTSERAQSLAARHVRWLGEIPGTPTAAGDRERSIEMVTCLGDMYVDDPRFAATYDGVEGATFVRDALHEYAGTRM